MNDLKLAIGVGFAALLSAFVALVRRGGRGRKRSGGDVSSVLYAPSDSGHTSSHHAGSAHGGSAGAHAGSSAHSVGGGH